MAWRCNARASALSRTAGDAAQAGGMAHAAVQPTEPAPSDARRRSDDGEPRAADSAAGGGTGGASKSKVLARTRASVVGSITDAIVAKDGEPFFLCTPDGEVPVGPGHGYGFYHHDCRFLSGYELRLDGRRLGSLAGTETAARTLVIELTNEAPDSRDDQHLAKEQIGVTWTRTVSEQGPMLRDELQVRNYGKDAVELPLHLRFAAGFEDVFEIRGMVTEATGTPHPPTWDDGRLVFRYDGGDDVERMVSIHVDPAPDDRDDDGATVRLRVDGRASTSLHVEVSLDERAHGDAPQLEGRTSPRQRPRENLERISRADPTREPEGTWIGGDGWRMALRTSSFALRAALGRSLDDLAQLRGQLDGLRYYEAGVPWFATLFGRDSLIAALQTLPWDPDVVAETLRLLAHRQGTHVDDWRDEQPGRILHELRIGELARMGKIPHSPYYGTIDATPLFLIVLARHAAWTGSLDLFRELRAQTDAALDWIDRYGDGDGDGFLDYGSGSGPNDTLVNQGWKDSGNAIVMADGRIADPPIALAEVQGYAWRAWHDIAGLLERDGDGERADELRAKADRMRERFEERFWSERLGCYVLAIADGRPCEVVTSNAGQVLWSGIASPDRARRVADQLLRPDMFSGWGIRTLSAEATAFHPVGYHLGTVWPHDNSLIAAGFRAYGLDDAAERIFLALLEAAQAFPDDRLPECFAGFDRDTFQVPVRYPVACHPQAWASGALPDLIATTLGLEPDGFANTLRIRRPRLPPGIELVELRDIPIGSGGAHVRFTRLPSGEAEVAVVGTSGDVHVAVSSESAA